jgi:hypothetical protein
MAALAEQNHKVTQEVYNIINCLLNNNVIGNRDKELDIWCQIFRRILKPDGKRLLCSDNEIRFNAKQRAQEALDYEGYPIEELAQRVYNFLEQAEYRGYRIEDILDEEQL